MFLNFFAFFILTALAKLGIADVDTVVQDISTLVSIAEDMGVEIANFNGSIDFNEALDQAVLIAYDAIYFLDNITTTLNDVSALTDASGSSEIASVFQQLADPVATLITNLDAKVQDFVKVYTFEVAQQDLLDMSNASVYLLSALYGVTYCGPDGETVGSVGSAISSGFVDAFSVYNVSSSLAPVVSSCVPTPVTSTSVSASSSATPSTAASVSSSGALSTAASVSSSGALSTSVLASSGAQSSGPFSSTPTASVPTSSASASANVSSPISPTSAPPSSSVASTITSQPLSGSPTVTTYTTTQTFTDCSTCKGGKSTRTIVVTETLTSCPSSSQPVTNFPGTVPTGHGPGNNGPPPVAPENSGSSQPPVVAAASRMSMELGATLFVAIAGTILFSAV